MLVKGVPWQKSFTDFLVKVSNDGEGVPKVAFGGLPFPGTGCPVPNFANIYLSYCFYSCPPSPQLPPNVCQENLTALSHIREIKPPVCDESYNVGLVSLRRKKNVFHSNVIIQ